MNMSKRSIRAREAVRLGPKYITDITGREPERLTGVEPTDEGGWIVEAELVEERRIPSSADMLALYEIELDADGELLAYARTRRYMRGQRLSMRDDDPSANGNANSVEVG
jgi:gas vesicle protein GvpO